MVVESSDRFLTLLVTAPLSIHLLLPFQEVVVCSQLVGFILLVRLQHILLHEILLALFLPFPRPEFWGGEGAGAGRAAAGGGGGGRGVSELFADRVQTFFGQVGVDRRAQGLVDGGEFSSTLWSAEFWVEGLADWLRSCFTSSSGAFGSGFGLGVRAS